MVRDHLVILIAIGLSMLHFDLTHETSYRAATLTARTIMNDFVGKKVTFYTEMSMAGSAFVSATAGLFAILVELLRPGWNGGESPLAGETFCAPGSASPWHLGPVDKRK